MKKVVTEDMVKWTADLQNRIHAECRTVKDLPLSPLHQANVMLSALTYEVVALCRAIDISDKAAVKGIQDCFANTPPLPKARATSN